MPMAGTVFYKKGAVQNAQRSESGTNRDVFPVSLALV